MSREMSLVSEFHNTYRYSGSSGSSTTADSGTETGTRRPDVVAKARATWGVSEAAAARRGGKSARVVVFGVVIVIIVWVLGYV